MNFKGRFTSMRKRSRHGAAAVGTIILLVVVMILIANLVPLAFTQLATAAFTSVNASVITLSTTVLEVIVAIGFLLLILKEVGIEISLH